MRLKILGQLARANITAEDILSLMQQSMLLNVITEKKDELLPEALVSYLPFFCTLVPMTYRWYHPVKFPVYAEKKSMHSNGSFDVQN